MIYLDPWGLWTLQIGTSGQGGAVVGGQSGGGIIFGYSEEHGFQLGTYEMSGVGTYAGVGGSGTVDISWSGNSDINDIGGTTFTTGGSVDALASIGGEVNIPIDQSGSSPSVTVSVGGGIGPVPFEEHGFVTHTDVQEVWSSENGFSGFLGDVETVVGHYAGNVIDSIKDLFSGNDENQSNADAIYGSYQDSLNGGYLIIK